MKKVLVIFFLLCCSTLYAQKIDYNKVIPEHYDTLEFAEKLVHLAWQNNPQNEVFRRKINQAEAMVFQSKFSWLNNINMMVQYHANQFTPGGSGAEQAAMGNFLPNVGLGFMINVGSIVFVPSRTKVAREEVEITKAELNSQKLLIRREVLNAYEEYLKNNNLLKIRTQAADDAHSSYLSVVQKFKNGEVSLEDFNDALDMYTRAIESKMALESEVKISKINLEEFIGVKLEEVR
jgi:outer membrane protein TolC